MSVPHATVFGSMVGAGTHAQIVPLHRVFAAVQSVPVPVGPPGQRFGMVVPHMTVAASIVSAGAHTHARVVPSHIWPGAQVPMQRPPHVSSAPHIAVAGQFGRQTHMRVVESHICLVSAHGPEHLPPQPSAAPHILPVQSGVHTHRPKTQRVLAPTHAGSQLHVGRQTPFSHASPGAQFTAAQGSSMQRPSLQNWFAVHRTLSQGFGGMHT